MNRQGGAAVLVKGKPQSLDYARPFASRKASRLGIASLFLAVVANPFFMRHLVYDIVLREQSRRLSDEMRLVVLFLPGILAGFVGWLALVLIKRRPERLTGTWTAWSGICISVCWALLLGWGWMMLSVWRGFRIN